MRTGATIRPRPAVAMAIAVEVLSEVSAGIPADAVERLVVAVLEAEGADDALVVVAFVDESVIAELNVRYRGVEGSTDVLSFPEQGGADGWPAVSKWEPDEQEAKCSELGEIVVCPTVVYRYAAEEGNEPQGQMAWTLVHGALHLLGYDHETDAGEMRRREQALLRDLAPLTESLTTFMGD